MVLQKAVYPITFVFLIIGCSDQNVFRTNHDLSSVNPSTASVIPQISFSSARSKDSFTDQPYAVSSGRKDTTVETNGNGNLRNGDSSAVADSLLPEDEKEIADILETARQHYLQALQAEAEGDSATSEVEFEEAIQILLNGASDYPSIETHQDFIDLSKSIVEDYEKYIAMVDQLGPESSIFALREKAAVDVEKMDVTKYPYPTSPIPETTVPLTMNDLVERHILFFTTKGRGHFERWMYLSGKYFPMMRRTFREEGVPEEVVYLAMMESGLNPRARSWARAVGMWQFIRYTGFLYGLRSTTWVDERRDFEKATRAAARHLKDLFEEFNDWPLALAAYNSGAGRINRGIRRSGSRDFWEMRRYLPRETRNYVPQYIAVTRMALRPDVYGFQNLPKADPLSYEYVTIDDCVDLSILAECAGTTIDTLKELNPELLYPFTPPSTKGYQLRVPLGSKDTFVVRYVLVPNDKKQNWAVHKVRKGETLSTIAKRYRVMVSAIAEVNKISRTRRLSIGKALLIPVPASYASIAQEYPEPSVRRVSRTAKIPHREASIAPAGRKKINYVVKKGETLGHIAEWYGVRTSDLRNWNNVPYGRLLQAGRSLAIWVESSKYDQYTKVAQMSLAEKNKFAKKNRPASDDDAENGMTAGTKKGEGEHLVTRGETLGSIAKKYQLSIAELKEMNDLRGSTVYAGQHLMVKKIDMIRQTKKESASSKKGNDLSTKNTAASKSMTHVVKKGETLERIASKYRVTVTDIKKWNKLTSNKILAGKKLFVQNPASGG